MHEQPEGLDRRTIPQRTASWATKCADLLAAAHLTPNSISVISVLVAAVAGVSFVVSGFVDDGARTALLIVAAVCMPLRLLCNMLDGMLAVEHGMKTSSGELYNELPDRISDLLVIAGAGYATAHVWMFAGHDLGVALGWTAAALALLTAYVRTLGASTGVGNFFQGLMAKPPRMWVLVIASFVSIAEPALGWPRGIVLAVALAVIGLGSLQTVVVRLGHIARALKHRSTPPLA